MSLQLSKVGLGTFPFSNVFSPVSEETAHAIVSEHLKQGGDYIETAPSYPDAGVSLSRILSSFSRGSFKLGTKCVVGTKDGERIISGKPDFLRRQVDSELARLSLDKLDLLQTHLTPSDETPANVAKTLQSFKEEGLVASIGVSNCNLADLKEYCSAAEIEWIQVRLSLIHRYEYDAISSFCMENGIKLNPFQVIERGQLKPGSTGPRRAGDLRSSKQEYTGVADELVRHWFSEVTEALEVRGVQGGSAAVAWALHRPAVGCAVLGATNVKQVEENWHGAEVSLSNADIALIDAAFDALEHKSVELHGQQLAVLRGVVR